MTALTPLYLTDMGIACSLGVGKTAVSEALFKENYSTVTHSHQLVSGRRTIVLPIPEELPDFPQGFETLNCRNNRLLKLVLDEIHNSIRVAKETYGAHRIGIVMATSTSGMREGELAFAHYTQEGSWPEEYHYEQQEPAGPSLFSAHYLGLTGPSYTISTACTSGGKAFCSAARLIRADLCDAVVIGGVDTLCNVTLNGFDSLELISETICTPFSKNRQGITIGEGAAAFLMTRTPGVVEFSGYGESSDAYHISTPNPTGDGAERAIRDALTQSKLTPEDIAYVNLHGTGTSVNDKAESHCFYRVFHDQVPASSTKGITGHTLGACGAVEASFLWLILNQDPQNGFKLPPHQWDGVVDPELDPVRFVKPNELAKTRGNRLSLLSNSLAFGGSNVSIILSRRGL